MRGSVQKETFAQLINGCFSGQGNPLKTRTG